MSTYLYLECLSHDPTLSSDFEVGQHLYNIEEIRQWISRRQLYVQIREAGMYPDYGESGENAAANFLTQHPNCHIGIFSEYGKHYSSLGFGGKINCTCPLDRDPDQVRFCPEHKEQVVKEFTCDGKMCADGCPIHG